MTRKILIVDDDPITLTMLSKSLVGDDVEVFTSRDGQEALDLVWKERPILVISDLLIPHLDGLDLSRTIKADEELHFTRVILMSAVYKGIQHKTDIWESGADDFITKPIDIQLLKEKIARLLA
jgi:DNA-binding response OmpR family regulator